MLRTTQTANSLYFKIIKGGSLLPSFKIMKGKYERKDGTRFDVIQGKKGLDRADEKGLGKYRMFEPVTEVQLKKELTAKEITRIQ